MDATTETRLAEILLVEDNPADVRLVQEAFREGGLVNRLHVVNDGEQAMRFLRREDAYSDAPRPDLMLLDLNLPRMNGREVLAEVKADETLCTIPIVILTVSGAEEDISHSYHLRCNCYIRKPVDLDQFIDVVKTIDSFWLTVVTLPPRE